MGDNHLLCTKELTRCSTKEIREFIKEFPDALDLSARELCEYMQTSYPNNREGKSRKKREAAEKPSETNKEDELAEHVKLALINVDQLNQEKNFKDKFKMIRKGGPLSESILHGSFALKQMLEELPEPMNWLAPVPYWKVIACSGFIVGSAILRYMDHPTNASRILKYVDMILKAPNKFDEAFWKECVLPIALELYTLMTDKDAKLPVPEAPRYYEDDDSKSTVWKYKKEIATLLIVFLSVLLNYLGYGQFVQPVVTSIMQIVGLSSTAEINPNIQETNLT